MEGQIINKDFNNKCVIALSHQSIKGFGCSFWTPLASSWGLCALFNITSSPDLWDIIMRFLRYIICAILFNFAELWGYAWIYISCMHIVWVPASLCGWVILCTQTFPARVLDSKDTLISSILLLAYIWTMRIKKSNLACWHVCNYATMETYFRGLSRQFQFEVQKVSFISKYQSIKGNCLYTFHYCLYTSRIFSK